VRVFLSSTRPSGLTFAMVGSNRPGKCSWSPKGVEHKRSAEREVKLLIELRGRLNTHASGERTAHTDLWI
jgi:hypothetical protein